MHGNVTEWIVERYEQIVADGSDVEEQPDVGEKPESELWNAERVKRGGSTLDVLQYHRAANRRPSRAHADLSFHTGFRVARTVR